MLKPEFWIYIRKPLSVSESLHKRRMCYAIGLCISFQETDGLVVAHELHISWEQMS